MDFDIYSSAAVDLDFLSPEVGVSSLSCRSLSSVVSCSGVGIHSGKAVTMRLLPAVSGSGIVFHRLDIAGAAGYVGARYANVFDTKLCTRIRNDSGVIVSTIEHICSALYGLGISDVLIELDGEEVPIMDGSCRDFVSLISSAGLCDLPDRREVLRVLRDVEVLGDDGRSCRLEVCDDSLFSFDLDFSSGLVCESYSFSLSINSFGSDIASARTFGLVSDLEALRSAGYALGASYSNVIGLGSGGVVNEGGLRYEDELVRHKILDAMGDLCLSGYLILGHYVGDRSGHGLNNSLVRELFSDPDNYRIELG